MHHVEDPENCSIDEDEYANSEELDAMLPEGDTTQEIVSDASGSDHAESEDAIIHRRCG